MQGSTICWKCSTGFSVMGVYPEVGNELHFTPEVVLEHEASAKFGMASMAKAVVLLTSGRSTCPSWPPANTPTGMAMSRARIWA